MEMPCRCSSATSTSAVIPERTATAAATLVPWSKASRAATWLQANSVARNMSRGMPTRGDRMALMGAQLTA
ncbi:hypothetical protein D3C83_113180 [compost metagenome]